MIDKKLIKEKYVPLWRTKANIANFERPEMNVLA